MKTALLLSGLPRLWRECLPSQLAAFGDERPDVFFHFWDTVPETEKADLVDLLRPRAYMFEAPGDFSAWDEDPLVRRDLINIPSRTVSQYYSWAGVGRLFAPYRAQYRLAMRSRSDLEFVASLGPALAALTSNDILLYWWDEGRLVSDLFALGGAEILYRYHLLYDHLCDYAQKCPFNPEALLTHHLEGMPDLKVYTETAPLFFVRRPHMAGYSIQDCLKENPGRNKWRDREVLEAHKSFFRSKDGAAGEAYVEAFKLQQLDLLERERGEPVRGAISSL